MQVFGFAQGAPILRSTLLRWMGAAALGALVGSTVRWTIGAWLFPVRTGVMSHGTHDRAWPWATLLVNVVGCLAIGWYAARLERASVRWHFVVTGVLGGFTTMSAVATQLNRWATADEHFLLIGYLVATVVGGLVALLLAERAATRRPGESP